MSDSISLDQTQLQKLLDAIHDLQEGGIHWDQVVPVFLSALLAILVGMLLEYFRSTREKKRSIIQRKSRELQQINGVTVGIAYNVEVLLHATFQNFLPHYEQSHEAYRDLQTLKEDGAKLSAFALGLGRYQALMMTCPAMHFEEFDFLEKLPFLIEQDAELVMKAGWLRRHSRVLDAAIEDRNKAVEEAARHSGTALNFFQLDNALRMQAGISTAECVTACELFESLASTANSLEMIARAYPGTAKRVTLPPALDDALQRLRLIRAAAVREMPAP